MDNTKVFLDPVCRFGCLEPPPLSIPSHPRRVVRSRCSCGPGEDLDLGEVLLEAWCQVWMEVSGTGPGGRHP